MAHLARIDNDGVVQGVVVVNNEHCPDPAPENETQGSAYLNSLGLLGTWVQTSYNGAFRKQYAGIGFTYDEEADVFVRPQPYPSWVLDESHDWQAPTPMPTEGGPYTWDEDTLSWVALDPPA
jgi:hypothetical protein